MKTDNESGTIAARLPDDEEWRAIMDCDADYNEKFRYAVATTGIFCRPSCRSRAPKREHVVVFEDADSASAAGYRPCKRCRPSDRKLPDDEWIGQMTAFIDRNYSEPITLERLAELYRGSPYHLHRVFRRIAGMTPVEYVQRVRVARAAELLSATELSLSEVAEAVGFGSVPYFMTVFKRRLGATPGEYRRLHRQPQHKHTEVSK